MVVGGALGWGRLGGVGGARGGCITPVRHGGTMEYRCRGGFGWIWLEMSEEKYVFRV